MRYWYTAASCSGFTPTTFRSPAAPFTRPAPRLMNTWKSLPAGNFTSTGGTSDEPSALVLSYSVSYMILMLPAFTHDPLTLFASRDSNRKSE